ncbi:MAG: hypothetical protein OXE46_14045 [Chloroflexi bacterium]|nr:hypothetical protein [Chloroflexota bacterium]
MSDDLRRDIIAGLERLHDHKLFEECAAAFLRDRDYNAALVPGGNDCGMDAQIADGEGEPYPVVVTISAEVLGNLKRNLDRYRQCDGPRDKCVVVTSQALTAQRRENLFKACREQNFTLGQVYAQNEVTDFLYRNSVWRKRLLNLSGDPAALSKVPPGRQQRSADSLVGREDALEWLRNTEGDLLVAGQPGAGKSALLHQLAKDENQQAWFVYSEDTGKIANALREHEPKILMLDGEYSGQSVVKSMLDFRRNYEAQGDFRFIVTCWQGSRQAYEQLLEIPSTSIHELRRLDRDEMAQLLEEAGIQHNPLLINEIANQATGLPGLALSLVELLKKDDWRKVQSAEALATAVVEFYKSIVDENVRAILAAFSIGGSAGMSKDTVAQLLGMNYITLQSTLESLAAGGIIAESKRYIDHVYVYVRPAALRHALIRDVFFSGAAALPPTVFDNLLSQAPEPKSTVMDLIGAKARGADVPDDRLCALLTQLIDKAERELDEYGRQFANIDFPTMTLEEWLQYSRAHEVCEAYAQLGIREARWAMNNWRGSITKIARPLLRYLPAGAIPMLLAEAVGDDRPRNAHSDHPLSILKNWTDTISEPLTNMLQRRKDLFAAAKKWIEEGNEASVGFEALMLCIGLDLKVIRPLTGVKDGLTVDPALFTMSAIKDMQGFWAQIIDLAHRVTPPSWQPILRNFAKWSHVYARAIENDEYPEANPMRDLAIKFMQMESDRPVALHYMQQRFKRLFSDLDLRQSPVLLVLYPSGMRDYSGNKAKAEWQQRADSLAQEWLFREPGDVFAQLEEYEREFREIQASWNPRVPYFFRQIAANCNNPLQWLDAALESQLPADVIEPFLQQALSNKPQKEETLLSRALNDDRLLAYVVPHILSRDDLTPELRHAAINAAPQILGNLIFSGSMNKFSFATLAQLLQHEDKSFAAKLALELHRRAESSGIPAELRPQWEEAILQYDFKNLDDGLDSGYWLEEVFKSETDLAVRWLKKRLQAVSIRQPLTCDGMPEVVAALSIAQRRELVELLPDAALPEKLVHLLVGESDEIFQLLLEQSTESNRYAMVPLHRDMDATWESFAKLALQLGRSTEDIARITRYGANRSESWSGRESALYEKWRKRFDALRLHSDPAISKIGEVGYQMCNREYEHARERETEEDVFGGHR